MKSVNVPNLIIVDDFFQDPMAIRKQGLDLAFHSDNRYFKGYRSTTRHLWPKLKERFEQLLGCSITQWESQQANGVFQWCPAGTPIVYHSDMQSVAGVIYLNPDAPPQSGTTLYRSRKLKGRTAQESATINGLSPEFCVHQMYDDKLLDPTAWEAVDVIGNVFNRLVLWNGKLVHAANDYFGTNKDNSRLSQAFFFDVEK